MWLTLEEEKRRSNEIAPYKVKCKECGHVVVLIKQNKTLCTYCGKYIFKNKKEEFKYRMKEKLKKVNEQNNKI